MSTQKISAHGYPTWDKDPQALKDYVFDWSDWLGADTISSSEWTVPDGLVKNSQSHTTTLSAVWVGGGVLNRTYKISNKIVTTGGRTDVRSFELVIKSL